jgi:RNA polymerase sigma factor (sigma-70 family)
MKVLQRPGYDLDLTKLRDEELAVLAAECGFQPAEEELLLRYRDWSNSLIGRFSRLRKVAVPDVEDALQDAVLGILKAIAHYDTLQIGKPNGCSFRTFLRRVLTDRFKDFLKHLWRVKSHFGQPVPARPGQSVRPAGELVAGPRDRATGGWDWPDTNGNSDPAAAAQGNEFKARIHETLDRLDDVERSLSEGLMAGKRLRVIAVELDISYDAAKRRWKKLRTKLAMRLEEFTEAPPARGRFRSRAPRRRTPGSQPRRNADAVW